MLALLAVSTAAGCAGHKPAGKGPKGTLVLSVDPGEARFYVNEKLQGTADVFKDKPLSLSVGKYCVKLMLDGYFPEYIEVEITGGGLRKVELAMRKVPPPLVENKGGGAQGAEGPSAEGGW